MEPALTLCPARFQPKVSKCCQYASVHSAAPHGLSYRCFFGFVCLVQIGLRFEAAGLENR